MSNQLKTVSELLSQLQAQGATVKNAKEGATAGTALTAETLKTLDAGAGPFDAWVSWSKSL